MVLQAYIDDSYDDGPFYVLVGYVSTAERWAAFSVEWERLLRSHGMRGKGGKKRFKMSQFASYPDKLADVALFHEVINRHVLLSVSCTIDRRDVEAAKRRLKFPENPNAAVEFIGNDFDLCYIFLMQAFHQQRASQPLLANLDGPVDFYFDDAQEKYRILNGWEHYCKMQSADVAPLTGSQPRFESDDDFLPLQAADFRAWCTRSFANNFGIDNILDGKMPFKSIASPIQNVSIKCSQQARVDVFISALKDDGAEYVDCGKPKGFWAWLFSFL